MAHFLVIFGGEGFPGEGFDRALGALARLVEGLDVRAQRRDARAGYVLDHIAEVGADVGQAARAAVGLRVQTPVPIGVVEQPVLRVGALHHQDFAQVAGFAHAAHLLHLGIKAQIVKSAIAAAGLAGEGDQLGGVLD